jgi:repressor LexA
MMLTPRQQALLDFIGDFIARNQYPPSYEEIRVGLGLSTKSLVDYHLGILEAKGLITSTPGKSRTIVLVDCDCCANPMSTARAA